MMKKNYCVIFGLIWAVMLGIFSGNAYSLDFEVDTSRDPLHYGSILSQDGNYYTFKGSANFSVYQREPSKKIGTISWADDSVVFGTDYEFFLDRRILSLKQVQHERSFKSVLSLYNLDGNIIAKRDVPGRLKKEMLAVSRNRKYFGIYHDNKISIYSSNDFSEVGGLTIDEKSKAKALLVSSNGAGFVLIGQDHIFTGDVKKNTFDKVNGCRNTGWGGGLVGNYFENSADKFVVYFEPGYACVGDGAIASNLKIRWDYSVLRGIFGEEDLVYLVTSKGLQVHNAVRDQPVGRFEVEPFYFKKYGKSKYVKPFFIGAYYDLSTNAFLMPGSVTIKTLFRIRVKD